MKRLPVGRRAGFTLVEFLVVCSVLAILAGLILPAVQSAREGARRARCANNLRQLAFAASNFEASFNAFPSKSNNLAFGKGNNDISVTSVHVALLPYLEQRDLYNSLNFQVSIGDESNFLEQSSTVARTTVSQFLCPSEVNANPDPYACVSYRLCDGLGEYRRVFVPSTGGWGWLAINTGAFGDPAVNNPASTITDGLSNTLAFSEKRVGSGRAEYQPRNDWIETATFLGTADEWVDLCANLTNHDWAKTDGGRRWPLAGARYTCFYTILAPNSTIPDCGAGFAGGVGTFTARSYHPAGVNAAMVDGSVRWFSSTIKESVWRALGTRAGMEVDAGD